MEVSGTGTFCEFLGSQGESLSREFHSIFAVTRRGRADPSSGTLKWQRAWPASTEGSIRMPPPREPLVEKLGWLRPVPKIWTGVFKTLSLTSTCLRHHCTRVPCDVIRSFERTELEWSGSVEGYPTWHLPDSDVANTQKQSGSSAATWKQRLGIWPGQILLHGGSIYTCKHVINRFSIVSALLLLLLLL